MGRIDGIINDELDKKFRIKVVKVFGGRKGDISKGLEAAITYWLSQNKKTKKK